jgi:hypothetical protein
MPPLRYAPLVTSRQTADEAFGEAATAQLVEHTLNERFEQGCWLPEADTRPIIVDDKEAANLAASWSPIGEDFSTALRELEARTQPGLKQDLEPAARDDRFLIITQQCDLVREPVVEPTFEVVAASWTTDRSALGEKKNLRSWRELVVADVPAEVRVGLVADSRRRALVDKRALLALPARQALPDDSNVRRRFAYWVGMRYYRRPIPHDLAERVARPLRAAMKDRIVRDVLEKFLMLVLATEHDRLRLCGICEREEDADALERELFDACERIEFEGLSAEDCEVRHVGQAPLTWALGAGAYPLDLESYSQGEEELPPALRQ